MHTRRAAAWLAGLSIAAATAYQTRVLRLSAFSAAHAGQHYEDIAYLPPSSWAPVFSLGFNAALADLMWCRSLVYFGEGVSQQSSLRYVFAYTDAILALDPSFREAYRWIATAAVYRTGPGTTEEALRAADYLERALVRWPTDGELHWDLGSLLRFDIAPMLKDRARKDALAERAAPHLAAAARLGAGPPWLVMNNASLLERLGQVEQSIRHLEEAYATISDETVRAEILARLTRLRGAAFAEAQRSANARLEAAHADSFPYLSTDAFVLVQARAERSYELDVIAHFLPERSYVAEPEEPDPYNDAAGSPSP